MEGIRVLPLNSTIGAQVYGVDLTGSVSEEIIAAIRTALCKYHLLLFPKQALLSPAQHVHLGEQFGSVENNFPAFAGRSGDRPELIEFDTERASIWQGDLTASMAPPSYCILQIRKWPQQGGDTLWASASAAFEALSPLLQTLLEGMTAIHRHQIDLAPVSQAEHPVVRAHPESGRRSLFVNPLFTAQISDLWAEESALLLGYLYTHMYRPEFTCRHQWSVGDVAFWDNRYTTYCTVGEHDNGARVAYKISIKGNVPSGIAGLTRERTA